MEKITLETAKTGSELVLETLRDLGIDTIFGYPGGAVLPLYDSPEKITFTSTRTPEW